MCVWAGLIACRVDPLDLSFVTTTVITRTDVGARLLAMTD